MTAKTNEWEFQGAVLTWLNVFVADHGFGWSGASQEAPSAGARRSDIVLWEDQAAGRAILEIELKTPKTPLADPMLRRDSVGKAQHNRAPYILLWNMRNAEMYKTPQYPRRDLMPDDFIASLGQVSEIKSTQDWTSASNRLALRNIANNVVRACHDLVTSGAVGKSIVDATIFVDSIKEPVDRLRLRLHEDVGRARRDRSFNLRLVEWADVQGLSQIVKDLDAALAGQVAYRITGQLLFYFAFRRQHSELPALNISTTQPATPQLRQYWDRVRTFDYEALFSETILDEIKTSSAADAIISEMVDRFARYDWDAVREDVLGEIFQQFLPESQRILLGQYYTPANLADLVLSMTVRDDDTHVLDPAVGSGTFLFRAYDRLRKKGNVTHDELLSRLWGLDISAFPAELAVINLCRQDFSSQRNYPRILPRDFFRVNPGDLFEFPQPKAAPGAAATAPINLPAFDVVIGNPPFIRSQQLDDLQSTYKDRLATVAMLADVSQTTLCDAFAYFVFHAYRHLRVGGRLGFVTSASWLTTSFGRFVQHFLLTKFRLIAVVFSEAEVYFPEQKINTIAFVAEKRDHAAPWDPYAIRFITLTRALDSIFLPHSDREYWLDVDQFADQMLSAGAGSYPNYRIALRDAASELEALRQTTSPRNWAMPFRESAIFADIFGEKAT